jgi:hypothetical protein
MLYSQKKHLLQYQTYTLNITELHSTTAYSESIYDINNIRRSWSDLRN